MRKFNFIYLLLAFVGVLTLTSCEHKYADYTPGPQDKNMGAYFASTDDLVVTADATSVNVVITRANSEGAATLSVRAEDVNSTDLFTFPREVNFENGATDANYTITFEGALEEGKVYPVRLQIDQTEASQYAISEYVFSIYIPEPWVNWGTGTYVDDFYCALMAAAGSDIPAGYTAPVPFQKHDKNENRIRVVNPASMDMFSNLWGGVPGLLSYPNGVGDTYLEFDITDPADVKMAVNPAPMGVLINFSDGSFEMGLEVVEGAKIIYEEGKIIFPKGGVVMGCYVEGSYYQQFDANIDGMMMFAVPGVEINDYAIAATYGGMTVEADNTTNSAILDFFYGADVATFKFAVLPGNVTDASATVEAIVAGSEDLTIFEGVAEENGSTFKVELPASGTYTVVTVPYNAEGEAIVEETNVYPFYYPGLGGAEKPVAEIKVLFDSVFDLTGMEEYEAQFPSAYFAAAGIVANADELKSIKIWVGETATIVGSGYTPEEILAGYGADATEKIEVIREKGSVVLGPYNFKTGSTVSFLAAIETLYGDTQFFNLEYTLPDAAPFVTGDYKITDGDYSAVAGFTGGYDPTQAFFNIDGFSFLGVLDTEAKTLTFEGYEPDYEANIWNNLYFYYDQAKTMAFGWWSTSTTSTEDTCPLVITYGEDGLINAFENYFSCLVFNLSDSSLAKVEYSFSPAAVITKVEAEEEEPAPSALRASAPSMEANLTIATASNLTAISAEPYNGARTGRPVLSVSRF